MVMTCDAASLKIWMHTQCKDCGNATLIGSVRKAQDANDICVIKSKAGYDTYLSRCHSPCKSINRSPMFGCN
eukprot:SAG25_NODE_1431_length_3038_cov_1.853692_1_plen_71_part_10